MKVDKEKLVSVQFYIQRNVMHAEFANTFSNFIDLDKINNAGYSTKGSEHGVGLSLVKKIVKQNKEFKIEQNIFDKFFVTHLMITIPKDNLKK
jgi:two-component system sensor histidine kinase AgrC